jgi:hypothetical protein
MGALNAPHISQRFCIENLEILIAIKAAFEIYTVLQVIISELK